MQFHINSGARNAPIITPTDHRTAKLAARNGVSRAIAATLADLAFGTRHRDHTMLLAGLVADRASNMGAGR